MKQHIHLLDRRASVLSDFPASTPLPIVNLVKIHSLLFQHQVRYDDFETTNTWSPKSIGCMVIMGATRNSTKFEAIKQICDQHQLVANNKNGNGNGNDTNERKKESSSSSSSSSLFTQLQIQNIPFTHYVVWKNMKVIPDILECFWRDRTWLCPEDFVCVAERVKGYIDPAEWKIPASHIESDQRIAYAVSKIAKDMGKEFVANPQPELNQWDAQASRTNISPEEWKAGHPYFKNIKYNQNGFIFLPNNKIKTLKKEHSEIYDAILKNELSPAMSSHWRKQLLEHVAKQYQQFESFGLDTCYFAQANQWMLPELLYFCVCPPRPKFPPNSVLQQIQPQIQHIIHFELESKVINILEKKNNKENLIMYMKRDFADFFNCPSPIVDQNDFVFITGKQNIVQWLKTISEQHLIPLSDLYVKPKVNRSEYLRLMAIKEANNLKQIPSSGFTF